MLGNENAMNECGGCGSKFSPLSSHQCQSNNIDTREQRRYEMASKLLISEARNQGLEGFDTRDYSKMAIEIADIFLAELEKTEVEE